MPDNEGDDDTTLLSTIGQEPPLPWPHPGHSLTKPGPSRAMNVDFEWSRGRPLSRIMGYREAAQLVFERIQSDRSGRDTLIFPLAFLWRHAIELQLKWILERGQMLMRKTTEYPHSHDVQTLWTMAQEVIEALREPDHGEIENTTRIINELSALDPKATAFRYHQDKKGQPSLAAAPHTLHLGQMNEAFAGVSQFLDGVSDVLENAIEYAQ